MRYGRLMTMAIVFAGAPFAPAALAQQNANQPQKWEYKVINYCDPENQPPVYAILPALGLYRTPSLTITDPSYRQVLDQRAKSDQGQKQREFVF